MPIALLIVGALLIIVAFQNTMGELARQLGADIPGYFKWLVAIVAILVLGYVPQLRTASRVLLGLVVLVVVLTNYRQMIAGFKAFASSSGAPQGTTPPDPASSFTSSPAGPLPSPAAVSGGASSSTSSPSSPAAIAGNATGGMTGGGVGGVASILNNVSPQPLVNLLDPTGFASTVGSSIGFGGFL